MNQTQAPYVFAVFTKRLTREIDFKSKVLASILNSVEKTQIVFASQQANEFNMVLTPNSIQSKG